MSARLAPGLDVAAVGGLALRRAALWAMLAAGLVAMAGLGWDIRWHLLIGRDSFWIPPHLMLYAGVTVAVGVVFGVLAVETIRAARSRPPTGTVRLFGLVGTPGFHLAAWGLALTVLAAPIDDLWHRLFGVDVSLWSPPHLLGFVGGDLHGVGLLVIAAECWPWGSRARWTAIALGATAVLSDFETLADPALRTAFLGGGALFFGWPLIGAALFTFVLVLAARLAGSRAMPLALAAGSAALYLAIVALADTGFALIEPVSMVEEVIRGDPTSPIAVAQEIARLNGASPGDHFQLLRFLPLVPAGLMWLVDARRRWLAASLAFGLALFVVGGLALARVPALARALPAAGDIVLALPLVLAAAAAGGWCARLAERLLAPRNRRAGP